MGFFGGGFVEDGVVVVIILRVLGVGFLCMFFLFLGVCCISTKKKERGI